MKRGVGKGEAFRFQRSHLNASPFPCAVRRMGVPTRKKRKIFSNFSGTQNPPPPHTKEKRGRFSVTSLELKIFLFFHPH